MKEIEACYVQSIWMHYCICWIIEEGVVVCQWDIDWWVDSNTGDEFRRFLVLRHNFLAFPLLHHIEERRKKEGMSEI